MNITATIIMDDNNIYHIEARSSDGLEKSTVQQNGEFTQNQVACMNMISELLRALVDGKRIDQFYNPNDTTTQSEGRILKCRWTQSGFLQVMEHSAMRRFAHATTVSEALERKGCFTCSVALYEQTPKKRASRKKQDPNRSIEKQRAKEAQLNKVREGLGMTASSPVQDEGFVDTGELDASEMEGDSGEDVT